MNAATEGSAEADRKVRAYVMWTLRSGSRGDMYIRIERDEAFRHLRVCPSTTIDEAEAEVYRFWDTGVTGATFTASLRCEHGVNTEWQWGELGRLPEILAALDDL